jgi:LysM domain
MSVMDSLDILTDSLQEPMPMMRITAVATLSLLGCLLLAAGCTGERSASRFLETTNARAQADAVVRDTQAEFATLRQDLAAARIATAKHEAEAGELRRQANSLQTDRTELRKMLEQAQSAITALQSERDETKQVLVQTQTVSVVRQASGGEARTDGNNVQADMKELKAQIVTLSDGLAQLKQRLPNKVRATSEKSGPDSSDRSPDPSLDPAIREEALQPRIIPSTGFLAPAEAAPRPGHASALSPQQGLIRVQPGDSLWKLAHKHATTIDELKRLNRLTTNVVHAGQRLILPSPMSMNISP